MKKLMIALAFAGLGTVAANAQTTIETPELSKYTVATNSFWSNWFIQVGVDASVQNPYRSKFADQFHDGRSYGVNLAIGKYFTPGLALRLHANWDNGIIERKHSFTFDIPEAPNYDAGGYASITGDVMFNLSNMLCGYSDTRTWNFVPFLSAGVIRNFNANTYSPVLGVGIENTWRFGKHFGIYLDAAYKMTRNDFIPTVDKKYEDKPISHGILSAELGLTFYLGKATFAKAVTIDQYNALAAASEEALAKLRADLDRERQINADLRAQLAKQPKAVAETKVISAGTSVFFDINSTKINSKKDLVNLESVATVAKNSGCRILVTGSADSKTGSAAWNQQLSEGRAQAVADELVNLGVSRDKIETKAVGGINEVSPYTLNRRALVELK
ncbi:MAG: OmpA family protein, partial [Bacteroidaceae bacterium]|nr:OmpA family protein [Bacteroidaceae bacterium]MBR3531137.1 OmpA family protein [Bacteroidaceae bacterium]